MSGEADWSETPPGQVGSTIVDDAIAEEDAKRMPSSGLSDAVDGIDIQVFEDDLLLSPSSSTVGVLVPVKRGILPTDLPPTMQAIDERSRVPMIAETAHASNVGSQMTSNDLKFKTLTSNDLETQLAPSTTQQVILTRTKPRVLTNARPANMPSLNPQSLIGDLDEYALSVPVVANWKYVSNPPDVLRMPFHGLEGHVRSRLTPEDRTKLQMSAHRIGIMNF